MGDVYVCSQVQALREMHGDVLGLDYGELSVREYLSRQADTLVEQHAAGNEAVVFHLACWCPQFIGKPASEIMSTPLSLKVAQETIAKEYGYGNWTAVDALGGAQFDKDYECAIDVMLSGRIEEFSQVLEKTPALAMRTSQHPHKATLLHYLAANGVESHRQVTPLNAAQLMKHLIVSGADVSAVANIYGGSTTMELWVTSAHPRDAGVLEEGIGVLEG